MYTTTLNEQEDILNTQTSTEEVHKKNSNLELITMDEVPGTPFKITGTEEKGYFLTLGKYRLTEYYETKTEALDRLILEQWTIMLRIITIVTEDEIERSKNNPDTIKP